MHHRGARKAGETDRRLFTLAAWREAQYFTEAERAALGVTEVGTRLADRAGPRPKEVLEESAEQIDEPALAVSVRAIASIIA